MRRGVAVAACLVFVAACGDSAGTTTDPSGAADESTVPASTAGSPDSDSGVAGESSLPITTDGASGQALPEQTEPALDRIAPVADGLIATMGSERVALGAVLLAGDQGYTYRQIIDAAQVGHLMPSGVVLAVDGSRLAPELDASNVLIDDVSEEAFAGLGLRAPSDRVTVSELMARLEREDATTDYLQLIFLCGWFLEGYSTEQIVTAILTDSVVRGFTFFDGDGNKIEPALAPYDPDDNTFSGTSWTNHPFFVVAKQAAGVYEVTPDLAADLATVWHGDDSISGVSGRLVIDRRGNVSGDFSYTITSRWTTNDGESGEYVAEWDRTLQMVGVTNIDSGLMYEAEVTLAVTSDGQPMAPATEHVTGSVDVDLGQIVFDGFLITESISTVRFER